MTDSRIPIERIHCLGVGLIVEDCGDQVGSRGLGKETHHTAVLVDYQFASVENLQPAGVIAKGDVHLVVRGKFYVTDSALRLECDILYDWR